ncbi:hypothetical protein ACQ4PT_031793 [Festuca glaucescens]
MPPTTLLLRRARARVRPRPLVASDSERRTRPRKSPQEDPGTALPDELLLDLEVFRQLPPPTDTIRCAAVCRRWRRVISSGAHAGCLPTPPRHFGFFRNYRPSPLPPFVATGAGVDLDVGACLPRVLSKRGADIVDGGGGLLVLRERSKKFWELSLVLCSPLERSYRRLPPVNITGYEMACAAFVPMQGAGIRVAVVLFGGAMKLWRRYAVLVHDSASAPPSLEGDHRLAAT